MLWTMNGKPESPSKASRTIYFIRVSAKSCPSQVAVIGVGGWVRYLTALHFSPAISNGIEVNRATLHILQKDYADFSGRGPALPGLTGLLRRRISWKGTVKNLMSSSFPGSTLTVAPGAANCFSESDLLYDRGIRAVLIRWVRKWHPQRHAHGTSPPREMCASFTTAVTRAKESRRGSAGGGAYCRCFSPAGGGFNGICWSNTTLYPRGETRLSRWTSGTHFIIPIVTPHLTSTGKNL